MWRTGNLPTGAFHSWDDLAELHNFIEGLKEFAVAPVCKVADCTECKMLPEHVAAELADLAGVSQHKILTSATFVLYEICRHTHDSWYAMPVYRDAVTQKLKEVKGLASQFYKVLEDLRKKEEPAAASAAWLLNSSLLSLRNTSSRISVADRQQLTEMYCDTCITRETELLGRASEGDPIMWYPDLCTLVPLVDKLYAAAEMALKNDSELDQIPIKGRPEDLMSSRFIRYWEYAARCVGGRWTLDKLFGTGTLIDSLEVLRPHLADFGLGDLPRPHPSSSYQRALTCARRTWAEYEHIEAQRAELDRRWRLAEAD